MKKYISILAAACVILLSGCAQDNAAVTVDEFSSISGADGVPAGAPGSTGTAGTESAAGTVGTTGSTGATVAESTTGTPDTTSTAGTAGTTGSTGATVAESTAGSPDTASTGGTPDTTVTPMTVAPSGIVDDYAPSYIGGTPGSAVDHDSGYIGGAADSADKSLSDFDSPAEMADAIMAAPEAAPGIWYDEAPIDPGYDFDYDFDYDYCMPEPEPVPPQAGLLTGGEWRDNDHWSDWNALYSSRDDWRVFKESWRIPFDNRIALKVTADGEPLEGARVSCGGMSAVTDNKGRAYLFYTALNGPTEPITVSYGDITEELEGVIGDAELTCELSGVSAQSSKQLDFMIMCDTTGSMSDELVYLQEELKDIINRIQHDNSNIPIRLSVNFYRDEGDEYVVCEYPFTEDIGAAVTELGKQYAAGGGDFPEAVHTALDSAVNRHEWNEDSVKLMFLVLDAPPHDDPQIIDSVNSLIKQAAEQGIRIIPIASSGIDKSTEYLLRNMAFVTGGTYTFLTNDSGIGGSHIEATVGAYNVERLNDMMVRIVNEYLQ
ncbi:MAG: VWA domain-containing protein [Oscillospiraceae bacterium]|nr:VWA domain-containing protein [Oscillospiraceae bacterium]